MRPRNHRRKVELRPYQTNLVDQLRHAYRAGHRAAGINSPDGDDTELGGPVQPLHLDFIGDALAGLAEVLGNAGDGAAAALGLQVGEAERNYGAAEDAFSGMRNASLEQRRTAAAEVNRAGDATYDTAQRTLSVRAGNLADVASQLVLLAEVVDAIDGAPGTDDDRERLAIIHRVVASAALVTARAVGLDFGDLGRQMPVGAFERIAAGALR